MRRFPFYRQLDQKDCGPTCLRMVTKFYGRNVSIDHLRQRAGTAKIGTSLSGMAEAAEELGMHALAAKVDFHTLSEDLYLPLVVHWRQAHFIVVYKITKKTVLVGDPSHGLIKYSIKEFLEGWHGSAAATKDDEGFILALETTPQFYDQKDEKSSDTYGFRYLFKYFRAYRHYMLQLILGLMAGSILQLIFPFLTQAVVDYGINYQNINFIYLVLIAQLTLFLSQTTVSIIRGWLLLHMTSRININLLSDFLIKLMRLPISFFDAKNTGDIVQRLQDHQRIQHFLSAATLNTLFSAFNLIIFSIILAYYNLAIFFIFLVGSLIYGLWTILFLKKREEIDYKRFDQASQHQSSIYQLISGMQEIKLNGSERRRRWEWENVQVKLFKVSIKGLALAQTQNNGAGFINEVKNIIITFVAASAVISGELTLGMMLSVQYIIGQLNGPIQGFITFIQSAQDAKISLERLGEIHKLEDEEQVSEGRSKQLPEDGSIYLDGVNFRYGGRHSPLVLDDVSCVIPEGKVTAIVGASGSGKTTLLKLLLQFYKIEEGRIRVGNTNLDDLSVKSWRKAVGTVMQDGFMFDDTVAQNITESDADNEPDKRRLVQAARIAAIDEFIERMPLGYNTKIGASGVNISGGQAQRLLIARAVYKAPKYMFFDEATSALDANNEQKIMQELNKFYEGRTVVVVAHRLSTVKNADQILVLDKGKIMEVGNHNSLVEKQGMYYTLVKNQLELGK